MTPQLILRCLSLKLLCNILVTCPLLLFNILHLGVSLGPSPPKKILTRLSRLSTLIFEHTKRSRLIYLLYFTFPIFSFLGVQFCSHFSAASVFQGGNVCLQACRHALSCLITNVYHYRELVAVGSQAFG